MNEAARRVPCAIAGGFAAVANGAPALLASVA